MPRLTDLQSDPILSASVLGADFARLAEEAEDALAAGADALHLDVMDGHFVPNLTMGPALCAALRRALPDAVLDVHLMVTDPAMFVKPFADAGADHVSFHIEAMDHARPLDAARELAAQIRALGLSAGLAVNPPTPLNILQGALDAFDMVLAMTVNPGFAGQAFLAEAAGRIPAIREIPGCPRHVSVDGGVDAETMPACREAGATIAAVASAIFRDPRGQREQAIAALRRV